MNPLQSLCLAALALLLPVTYGADFHPCSLVQCEPCHKCQIHSGKAKCVLQEECTGCPEPPPELICHIDPCHQWEQRCENANAVYCRWCNCPHENLICKARYYDAEYNQVDCEPLQGNSTNPEDLIKYCGAPAPPIKENPEEEYAPVYYYNRATGECLLRENVCPDTYTLNTFKSQEACESMCSSVEPCAAPLPGCVETCPADTDAFGCPTLDCSVRETAGCGGADAAASPCPPCHTCYPNYDPKLGYCCVRLPDEDECWVDDDAKVFFW